MEVPSRYTTPRTVAIVSIKGVLHLQAPVCFLGKISLEEKKSISTL